MSSQLYNKKQYTRLKSGILKCIKHINNFRNNKQKILGRKNDILKVIKIYKFYKKKYKSTNTKETASDIANTNKPQIIEKKGYQFIVINGMYHKLTKKTYTEKDMDNWCEGRQNASSKMKQIHALKKEKQQQLETEKDKEVEVIYNREFNMYPQELRELIRNTNNF